MNRRESIALVGGAALAWPLRGSAQQHAMPLIGFLHPGFPTYTGSDASIVALKDGLRASGYVEGKNIKIEARWGEGNPQTLPGFAVELVRMKVDVLVAVAHPSVRAAQTATRDLPIVALDLEIDPVASGFVASLAAPGGNITGLFLNQPSLTGKWLQLIKEVAPAVRRVAVLWDANTGEYQLRALSNAAKEMAVDLQVLEFRNASQLQSILTEGLNARPHALILLGSPLINQLAKPIAEISAAYRIPAISPFRSFPESGGIMSYGPVLPVWFRRLGRYVAAILKGANAEDLPIEQPTNFELVVSQKAAAAIAIKIPQGMLLRADEVIE